MRACVPLRNLLFPPLKKAKWNSDRLGIHGPEMWTDLYLLLACLSDGLRVFLYGWITWISADPLNFQPRSPEASQKPAEDPKQSCYPLVNSTKIY